MIRIRVDTLPYAAARALLNAQKCAAHEAAMQPPAAARAAAPPTVPAEVAAHPRLRRGMRTSADRPRVVDGQLGSAHGGGPRGAPARPRKSATAEPVVQGG
jgi:hypothetical protein